MDPLTEMSELATTYLWAWRELNGHDRPGLVISAASPDITTSTIRAIAGDDVAMYTRLRDLASRTPVERWSATDKSPRDVDAIVREQSRRRRQEQPGARHIKTLGNALGPKRDDDLLGRVYDVLLTQYVTDVTALRAVLFAPAGGIDSGATAIDLGGTRESVVAAVSQRLVAPTVLRRVAEALDYVPVLLRRRKPTASPLDNYPREIIAYCNRQKEPLPFPLVLTEELEEIEKLRRRKAGQISPDGFASSPAGAGVAASPPPRPLAFQQAFDARLAGISFSGGGIRSATFNLGVLQALAARGTLRRFDYLSTVSGGGYIGAWLIAWIKRRGSIRSVESSLRGPTANCEPGPATSTVENVDPAAEHVRPIRALREYSNYLAPEVGFFSTDTWTMVSIWLRNTVLNLLVLALFLTALLLAPRVLAYVLFNIHSPAGAALTCSLLLAVIGALVGYNLRSFDTRTQWQGLFGFLREPTRGDTPLIVMISIVAPLFVASFFATAALWLSLELPGVGPSSSAGASAGASPVSAAFSFLDNDVFLFSTVTCFIGLIVSAMVAHAGRDKWTAYLRSAWTCSVAAVLGGFAGLLLSKQVVPLLWADTQRGVWLAVAFGPLVVLFVLTCVIVLYLGLEGYEFPDERREWWSRLGAQIGLVGTGWALLSSISFFAPLWLARLGLYANAAGIGWGAITAAGARLASGGKSNGRNLPYDTNPITATFIKIAPFVFVLGFLVLLSTFGHVLMDAMQAREVFTWPGRSVFEALPFDLQRYVDLYWATLEPRSWVPPAAALTLCLAALFLAWRVDVNEFSMHHFYRNRLVRAYLGASRQRRHRRPNAFTGLDIEDDIKLWRFRSDDPSMASDMWRDCRPGYHGPFPIINTALNLTTGEELAWQERKAQSFVFTPLYCGFDFTAKQTVNEQRLRSQFAFRPTRHYGWRARGHSAHAIDGVDLGTAMAISGAAASPNSGYHTSPAVAFLLTVFNARLGWWMGNPALNKWDRSSPAQGLTYLLSELLGYANTQRAYVNLSDGGHFENLGIYELVRRRCRFILVCDAEQDENYTMEGLASAIRKCRVDFGVEITLDPGDIRPNRRTGLSRAHFARGTISYPGESTCGDIVYLKASIVGDDEPSDVLEYRARFTGFPHQSTADQFFDESQFESYRALGQHIAESLPESLLPQVSPI